MSWAEKWLTTYVDANPTKSAYAFCIDPKYPGYFFLCFKANRKSNVNSRHVRVIPHAYELMKSQYPDMRALCNGFKLNYQTESMKMQSGRWGRSKTNGLGKRRKGGGRNTIGVKTGSGRADESEVSHYATHLKKGELIGFYRRRHGSILDAYIFYAQVPARRISVECLQKIPPYFPVYANSDY